MKLFYLLNPDTKEGAIILGKSPCIPLFKRGMQGDLDLPSLVISSKISEHLNLMVSTRLAGPLIGQETAGHILRAAG